MKSNVAPQVECILWMSTLPRSQCQGLNIDLCILGKLWVSVQALAKELLPKEDEVFLKSNSTCVYGFLFCHTASHICIEKKKKESKKKKFLLLSFGF